MSRSKAAPWLLLLPHILLSALFVTGLGAGLVQSLGVIPALGLTEPTLDYYKEVLTRPDMLRSVLYSLRTALISALIATGMGVGICAGLTVSRRAHDKLVGLVRLPIAVPHVVVALLTVLLCSQNGLLARLACLCGLIDEQSQFPALLYDGAGVGVILAYVWKETPFIVYFVLALMANVNENLGQAAVNLGARPWRAFCRVTLPLCRNTILSGFLIIFVFALGAYELPFLLGATIPKALPVLAYIEYMHPDMRHRPYAMALNGIVILLSVVSAMAYYALMRRKVAALEKGGGA